MSAFKSKVWALAFTAERRGLGDVGRSIIAIFPDATFAMAKPVCQQNFCLGTAWVRRYKIVIIYL